MLTKQELNLSSLLTITENKIWCDEQSGKITKTNEIVTLSALTDRASIFLDVLFGQFINFLWKKPNLPLPWGRSWAQDIYAAWLLDQLPLRNAFHFHVYHCCLCVLSRDPQWNQSSWSTPLGVSLLGQQVSCLSQVARNTWKTSSRTNSENTNDTFTARVITHNARNVKSRLSDPAQTSSFLRQSQHELWYFRSCCKVLV